MRREHYWCLFHFNELWRLTTRLKRIKISVPQIVGVPLYVLEDRLFRVDNWEDQTKEDLASKFCKRREKIADLSP